MPGVGGMVAGLVVASWDTILSWTKDSGDLGVFPGS